MKQKDLGINNWADMTEEEIEIFLNDDVPAKSEEEKLNWMDYSTMNRGQEEAMNGKGSL